MPINERWKREKASLTTEIECSSFMEGVDLIKRIAECAESQNHHPDLFLHDYKYLQIRLQTHDSGGLTSKDERLAQSIDEILG